jgi:UDP-N-acetylglucosamine--N-acetylmuramyl-(pentapeptide) pyrophosphoryl-undecaprenol N-acetylglucosamine transferase
VFSAFEETRSYFGGGGKVRVFGSPVRAEIADCPPPDRADREGSAGKTLLVMGGSQGAHAINRAMIDGLEFLKPVRERIRIIHQTGEKDHGWVREAYEREGFAADAAPFLDPIGPAYAKADLVVARSGALTVAELSACGRPAILIPYPHAAHGHQEANARAVERAGAAELMLEKDLTGERLASRIRGLLSDPARLSEMARRSRSLGKPRAAREIVLDCLALVGR